MGDSPELANELAALIKKGIKNGLLRLLCLLPGRKSLPRGLGAITSSLTAKTVPVCVTRLVSMRLVRFCDVTAEFARKEGEGDLRVLNIGRESINDFLHVKVTFFSDDMELIMEEFEVVDVL
ncbi:MAG: ASCH domain-containing protein [Escherichia coli]